MQLCNVGNCKDVHDGLQRVSTVGKWVEKITGCRIEECDNLRPVIGDKKSALPIDLNAGGGFGLDSVHIAFRE